MTTMQFLAEWALRSSILILSGALLLRALLALSVGLLRGSPTTGQATEGIEIRESDGMASPVLSWHCPLSWLLHRRIVRVAEEVSDDAAVAAIRDRASYAEVLLDFTWGAVGAPVPSASWQ
jgi:hypothetical protein